VLPERKTAVAASWRLLAVSAFGCRPRRPDWQQFAAWAALNGATALPAHVGIVAAYLSHLASTGRKASTIGRKAAAIGHRHRMAGIDPLPTSAEGVHAVLRGIRRTIGTAAVQKAPVQGTHTRSVPMSGSDHTVIVVSTRSWPEAAFFLAKSARERRA
jgi:hypothetical protein